MRFFFINELIKEAKKNKNIYLLTSDLGFNAFENFKKNFPDRFINTGVAENNMIGVAAGLALRKKKVFVYSILPFLVFRSLEQIRNNICHNDLDIKVMAAGGGFSYGPQGVSHNTSEDISMLMSLPNLKIFNPGSKEELKSIISIIFKNKSPCFVRLGKCPNENFYKQKINLNLSKKYSGLIVKHGKDLTILSTGNILKNVVDVAKMLDKIGVSTKVVSFPILKPFDKNFLINNLKTKYVISVEENTLINGLGYLISNVIIEKQINITNFKSFALEDKVHKNIGSQDYLLHINNLSKDRLYIKIKKFLKNGK